MKIDKPGFVVMYKMPLIFSLVTWLLGWGILWNILPNDGELPKNSPGPWFDVLFWAAVVSVNGLLGPLLTLKYSLLIHVQEDRLSVRRYFGLFRRSYKLSDIVTCNVISPDAKRPEAKISFQNGDSLTVSGYASRFQELCSALGAR
jgi:hypothetical protein